MDSGGKSALEQMGLWCDPDAGVWKMEHDGEG